MFIGGISVILSAALSGARKKIYENDVFYKTFSIENLSLPSDSRRFFAVVVTICNIACFWYNYIVASTKYNIVLTYIRAIIAKAQIFSTKKRAKIAQKVLLRYYKIKLIWQAS